VGHNHPFVVNALKRELDKSGPAMLQSHVPEPAGELAERLCKLACGGLKKVYFGSSGSEGVEAAIKFARATTGRAGIVYARNSFHGLTAGALSVMNDAFWREGFGPLLEDTMCVPFGDLQELAKAFSSQRCAAFIVEPVQAEAGIHVPSREYLQTAQELCREHGCLFILDEVQTGMFRTGGFLAAHPFDLRPDMVILAKALSGGLMPVSAVLMTDQVYRSVYSSLKRAIVHTSTFSENSLSMRAGLATLEVLETEELGPRAARLGEYFRSRLRQELTQFGIVKEVRGLGLLNGIEFQPPKKLTLRTLYEAFHRIHPAMFGQVLVMRMFREKKHTDANLREQFHGPESGTALDGAGRAIRNICRSSSRCGATGRWFCGVLDRGAGAGKACGDLASATGEIGNGARKTGNGCVCRWRWTGGIGGGHRGMPKGIFGDAGRRSGTSHR
jgi:ornithine--oxo-acid transaminase